jgi:Sulfotransferase family
VTTLGSLAGQGAPNVRRYDPDVSLGSLRGVRPLFISGVYRSGTTFLTALINSHPKFVTSSSSVKFLRFCAGRYGDLSDRANRRDLIDETLQRVRTRWNLTFDPDAVEASIAASDASYAAMYDAIMRQMLPGAWDGGLEWAEKLAVQWDRIPDFLRMFPDGKVIHIFRDPRDATASYKAMTNEPWPTHLDAAFNCLHAMQTIERLQTELPASRLLVVRAEDISQSAKTEIPRICDFLEVPPVDAMFRPERYRPIAGEDWKTNTSFAASIEGFPAATPRWREHLTKAETAFVELITQPLMSRFGYQGSGYVPTRADWDEIASLLKDSFLKERFQHYIETGAGSIGYRTDPYLTEMRIVFPERFAEGGAR